MKVAPPPRPDVVQVTTSADGRYVATPRSSPWTPGRIVALVFGVLLALFSIGLLGAGGVALWADQTQRDVAGFISTDRHPFSTGTYAIDTQRIELGGKQFSWMYPAKFLDEVRIRVKPADRSSSVFVGIGPVSDVERYLRGVRHATITDLSDSSATYRTTSGTAPRRPPQAERFWAQKSVGRGLRTITWDVLPGAWSVVVMNADARSGIDVTADVGAKIPSLLWIAAGLLIVGGVFFLGAVGLLFGAARTRRVR